MKLTHRLLVTAIAAALALPIAAFAAKGNKKNAAEPAPSFASIKKADEKCITEAEFCAAMKTTLGEDGSKAKFATLDKNSDKKLTEEEYAAASTEPKKRKRKG
jgi:hypothetical protein